MPAYISSPFTQRPSLIPGQAGYSLGSYDTHNPGTRMTVTNVALTSNVATLTVTIREGYVPIVGALISVQGTQNSAGLFNVTSVALATVSINSTTGAGTVTFALTNANVASAKDSGQAYVPPPEIGDALTATSEVTQPGLQFAIPVTTSNDASGKNISWAYQFPSVPDSAAIQLEGAIFDEADEYSVIDAVASAVVTAGGESRSINTSQNWNFLRVTVKSASGGTNPTVLAKIVI